MKRQLVKTKIPDNIKRIVEIIKAAELGRMIDFGNGNEARLYREAYVKYHKGVVDIQCIETRQLKK